MPGRTTLFLAVLAAAGGLPYLALNGPFGKTPATQTSASSATPVSSPTDPAQVASLTPLPMVLPGEEHLVALATLPELPGRPIDYPQLSGPPGITVADVLRFDVTPAWLTQNWARVTPCLSEPDWQGLRVPLVSGTRAEDLVGTLTYSFNMEQRVERINLYALTGDSEPLAAFVQQRLGMQQYPSPGCVLFVGFFGEQPLSMLQIRPVSLQQAQTSNMRYQVDLEMNLPRAAAKLSDDRLKRWQMLVEWHKLQEQRKQPPAVPMPPPPTLSSPAVR